MRFVAILTAVVSVGSVSASDLPRVFMTSTKGTGDLSTWPDAHGLSGLAAADEVCRTRAEAASIARSEAYVAFLSDTHDDAYCRVHDLHGKRSARCGMATLPTDAGPWYRMDDLAAMDVAQNVLVGVDAAEGGYMPRAIVSDEFGSDFAVSPQTGAMDYAFTGSALDGSWPAGTATCSDWSSGVFNEADSVSLAISYRGYGALGGAAWTCDQQLRLLCLEKGSHGPALVKTRPPNARIAFITSTAGPGDFSTWPDGAGAKSVEAADLVCNAHAERAALPQPSAYKAWLSTASRGAIDRFVVDGPLYRPDGVLVARWLADLADGVLEAPIQLDENAVPLQSGQAAWSGTSSDGSPMTYTCTNWTVSDASSFGYVGASATSDTNWSFISYVPLAFSCQGPFHVYCLSDADSLFLSGFDP